MYIITEVISDRFKRKDGSWLVDNQGWLHFCKSKESLDKKLKKIKKEYEEKNYRIDDSGDNWIRYIDPDSNNTYERLAIIQWYNTEKINDEDILEIC